MLGTPQGVLEVRESHYQELAKVVKKVRAAVDTHPKADSHGIPRPEEVDVKARLFRLGLALSTFAMLLETLGAGRKWN